MKNVSVTVGIPAFNEEANIANIIKDLLAQKKKNYVLDAIVVNSDGSSDNTVNEVMKIRNKSILILNHRSRQGRAIRQNQIMKLSNSDILVLVDADTQIKDPQFVEKIITPIANKKADLTSVKVQELPSETFISQVLETSMRLKKYIFESINQGDNLYTCHGRARAFSKKLYKTIKFSDSVTEDAYSYLYCISKGFKYKFVNNTEIFYQLPESIQDHESQSIRFIQSRKILIKQFGRQLVNSSYKLPLSTLILSTLKFFLNNPIRISVYLLVFSYMKIKSIFKKSKNTWIISTSSKKLRKAVL